MAIDVGAVDDAGVRKAIEEGADPEAVCDVILTGVVPVDRVVDAPSLEREFADRFFRLRVQSSAHLWLDDDHLSQLPEDTVLGRFVRLIRARLAQAPPEERLVLEEALQVGVALLQGREVLS